MKFSTKLSFLGALIMGIILTGCASLPLPTAENQTLVVGLASVSVKGYEKFGSISVNGNHLNGITISIENIATGDITELTSDDYGLFYTNKLNAGEYRLTKLLYKRKTNSAWMSIYMPIERPDSPKVFTIQKDMINNLGEILWTQDAEKQAAYYYNNMNYDKVITEFKKLDEDNDWANVPISNVTLNNSSATDNKNSENLNI